jgi:hypothetical protein
VKNLGKEKKFRKDFTPEQYAAYLERKAKDPDALVSEIPQKDERFSKKHKTIKPENNK